MHKKKIISVITAIVLATSIFINPIIVSAQDSKRQLLKESISIDNVPTTML